MKEIPLTRGYVAFVDDCDYERVMAAGHFTNELAAARAYDAAARKQWGEFAHCNLGQKKD